MKITDIPLVPKGYATMLGGWGVTLVSLGGFITALGQFFAGSGDFELVVQSFLGLSAGLGILGLGRKAANIENRPS